MRRFFRGLRWRVAATTAGVAIAAVAAVGSYTSIITARAFTDELRPATDAVARAARETEAVLARPHDERELRTAIRAPAGRQFILFHADGSVWLASPDTIDRRAAKLDSTGAVRLELGPLRPERDEAVITKRRRIVVEHAPTFAIHDSSGVIVVARLVELPSAVLSAAGNFPPAVARLRRSLLVGVAVAIVGALFISFALSSRISGPLERLTLSARRLTTNGDPRTVSPVAVEGPTEVAELSTAFNAMLDGLVRAETLRRSMTSDIAHELRTPLTNVRCHIESLQDGIEEVNDTTLASLHEEVLILQRLVDDLQDLALAEQGRVHFDLEFVEVNEEIGIAIRQFAPRATSAGVRLEQRPGDDASIVTDRTRLRQILSNLITNALNHTPAGGTIAIRADSRQPGFVTVSIADTGRGIPAADVPNVFERFYRSDPSRSRARGGAGLGLAIVKHLVELLGGHVELRSVEGCGTVVEFTCPVAGENAAIQS